MNNMKNKENPTKVREGKVNVKKKLRRAKKALSKRDFWVKFVVIISALALIATSILPYLLI